MNAHTSEWLIAAVYPDNTVHYVSALIRTAEAREMSDAWLNCTPYNSLAILSMVQAPLDAWTTEK